MYLVDTNIVSELRKRQQTNVGVQAFWQAVAPDALYLSVFTIGELQRGAEKLRARGDLPQAQLLTQWLAQVEYHFAGRVLPFDTDCAHVWGRLMVPDPQHPIDKQIAAIALIHDLTVVTRNVADFAGTGVALLNPFR